VSWAKLNNAARAQELLPKALIQNRLCLKAGFLAVFGGMTVVHLGGQTDMPGAGTFWLVNVAARWFLRQDATAPQAAGNFLPTQASAGKMQIPALPAFNAGICWF